jgi:uncharacterized protein (UPF0262 family)
MCITSEDVRSQEEALIWDILCDECIAKAVKLLEERKAIRLFDIHIEEYGFCPKCTAEIDDLSYQLMKQEFGDEIP